MADRTIIIDYEAQEIDLSIPCSGAEEMRVFSTASWLGFDVLNTYSTIADYNEDFNGDYGLVNAVTIPTFVEANDTAYSRLSIVTAKWGENTYTIDIIQHAGIN